MKRLHLNKKFLLILLLVLIISLPSVMYLFHTGFFVTDDGDWMIIRFSAFHQAFRGGQIPVRFLERLNHGFGYPVANFLYPGFMYAAEPFKLLGLGFVLSIKIILILSMIGSGMFTFLWLKRIFSNWASVFGSLVYIYLPYHLYDLYKRGSVGELLALAIVPFILWQIERRNTILSSLGIAFLILAHNTLAALFLPIIIGYIFVTHIQKRKLSIFEYQTPVLLGLGLSAFFWIPALVELHYTIFAQVQVSEWQRYFADTRLVGFGSILLFVAFAMLAFQYRRLQTSSLSWKALLFIASGFISILLSLSISTILWQVLPVSFVQFPFRFLSILIVSAAFLSAFLIDEIKGRIKYAVALVLLIILGLNMIPYLKVQSFTNNAEGFYATNEDSTTVKNEYMPKWVQNVPSAHFVQKVEVVNGLASIEGVTSTSKNVRFQVTSQSGARIRLNTIYYPGWRASINGGDVDVFYDNPKGVMEINVPKGNSAVSFRFSETPMRIVADGISLLSCLVLLLFPFYRKKLHLII